MAGVHQLGCVVRRPGEPVAGSLRGASQSKLRDEFLNLEDFECEAQAQASGTLWGGVQYSTECPHSSLAYQSRRSMPLMRGVHAY